MGLQVDREVEVKFSVGDPAAAIELLEKPRSDVLAGFEAAGPLREVVAIDRYFDTARGSGRLQAAGMRARLRTVGDDVVLAVKHAGLEDEGVTTRVELEGPASSELDPAAWPPSEARRALLEATGGAPLVPIATLHQRRVQRLVRRGATLVEISLDTVEAVAPERGPQRRTELELELLTGDAADLRALARAVATVPGIGLAHGPKLAFALGAAPTGADSAR
jgi:inorganic triphosphatase YgiF